MADARIIKFDVGSPTDKTLNELQKKLNASTGVEAVRRSLSIANAVTDILKNKKQRLFVESEDGTRQELMLPGA